jgi:hypothetical protein
MPSHLKVVFGGGEGAEREGCLILFVSSNSGFSKCFSIKTSTSFMKEPVKNQWLRVGFGAHSLILENNQTRVRISVFYFLPKFC